MANSPRPLCHVVLRTMHRSTMIRMCGRFSLSTPPEIVAKLFDLGLIPRLSPRYNIAPTQSVAVIRAVSGDATQKGKKTKATRQLDFLHWGLIPHWADDPSIGNR